MKLFLFPIFIFICFNFHAQIVINEINVKPSPDALDNCIQSLKNCSSVNCGSEYVEFYNNSDCPVDISCYIFITESFDGARDGAFRFPAGTVLAARGFTSIGGANSGATFSLPTFCADDHMLTNNTRWYLDNGDAWVALYDDNGGLVDAVFWTAGANQSTKWPTDSDLDDIPPYIPAGTASGCPAVASLPRPSNTVGNGANEIEYAGMNPALGQVLERTTDGTNTWAMGAATINSCNGACVTATSFFFNATVQQPTCGASDGSISFAPQPAGSYAYTWTPNVSSTNSATGLNANSYDVSVQIAPGCVFDTTIVLVNSGGITSADVVIDDATCGQSDGQIEIQNIVGGTAPYQVNFNSLGFAANLIYSLLPAGDYSVVIQDASGCQLILTDQTVGNGGGPTGADQVVVNTTCGQSNGSIAISNVQGGVAPYTFSLNGAAFVSNATFSNLASGNYSVTIQDANLCQFQLVNINVAGSTAISSADIQTQDPSCGNADGSVTVSNILGGTVPYQVNFDNQGFVPNLIYNGLVSGIYSVVVQDQNGCELTLPNVILNSLNGPSDLDVVAQDASCSGSNGSISIGGVVGGLAPYQFAINGGALTNQQVFNSLPQGNYIVSVQDDAGCVYSENISIGGSVSPIANFNFSPNQLSTDNTTLNLINTSSNDVVSYSWNFTNCSPNNATEENPTVDLTNMSATSVTATLIVTNAAGCIDSISKVILVQSNFNFYAPNAFTPDGDEYNNEWKVYLNGVDLVSYQLLIFNRWGEIMLESYDSTIGWDGTYNGALVKEGAYTWKVSFKDLNTDKKHEFNGHLFLIK